MTPTHHSKYFIVKHGLDAFKALPNFIWNTSEPKSHMPRGYRQIEEDDRWISFAYTTSDNRERPLSHITGFFECTKKAWYGDVPRKAHPGSAWMIAGKHYRHPLSAPVVIPPIQRFLSRRMFNQATITQISKKEFERIQNYTSNHRLDPTKIPLLGREPRSEQELVAVVACGHKKIGIEKIVRVQTAFPDMLVKIKGRAEPVHLELEVYSTAFLDHGHQHQVRQRRFKGEPVAVLCWIDDDWGKALKPYVHRVYVLQALIREGRKIRW